MSDIILLNDRYILEDKIGSGGMAVVYRGRDQMLERSVAIKTLRKNFSNDPEFRERFSQEAKSAAKLTHPNIVTIHDFGLDSGRLFIIMEFVPGFDLKTLIKQNGRLTAKETIHIMRQACAGIGYAHRAGLVHCDVKPQNILVTPDRLIKVADFGIARALSSINTEEKENLVWGSPNYFSPEQASGSAPFPPSDVYALGVIMFEMMTGQLPFSATTSQELARLHREAPPPSPCSLNADIPIPLEKMILKALSKDPSHRYQTAGKMGQALIKLSQHSGMRQVFPNRKSSQITAEAGQVNSPTYQIPSLQSNGISRNATGQNSHAFSQTTTSPSDKFKNLYEELLNLDWIIWVLVFVALITLGGLIPFWLWVYYTLNPP